MSAGQSPNQQQFSKQLGKIKQQTSLLLHESRQSLWEAFTLLVLNNIQVAYRRKKSSSHNINEWIKQQIEIIMKWISSMWDKQNLLNLYSRKQKYWYKQQIEWENTFENLLINSTEVKNKHEQQMNLVKSQLMKLQQQISVLKAKNSLLKSTTKICNNKFEMTKNKSKSNHFRTLIREHVFCIKIQNPVQSEQKTQSVKQLQCVDKQTMTVQMLTNQLSSQQEIEIVKNINSIKRLTLSKQYQIDVIKRQIKINFTVLQYLSLKIRSSIQKQDIGCGTFELKQKQNVQQILQNSVNSVSSSISSSIYECDRGTQTILCVYNNIFSQTASAPKPQHQNQLSNSMVASLLKRIHQLEAESQDKHQKQQQIKKLKEDIIELQRQVQQLKNQLRIAQSIEIFSSNKKQQIAHEYKQLQIKYQELLDQFSIMIPFNDKQSQIPQSKQKMLPQQNFDDQLLPTQSSQHENQHDPEQQSPCSRDHVDRKTISRYFLNFVAMHAHNQRPQNKLALLETIIAVLGIQKQEVEKVYSKYKQANLKSDFYLNNSKRLESKPVSDFGSLLFKYLTSE